MWICWCIDSGVVPAQKKVQAQKKTATRRLRPSMSVRGRESGKHLTYQAAVLYWYQCRSHLENLILRDRHRAAGNKPEKPQPASGSKITALQEKEIKFASKPSVTFDQLKIKASFSLQEVRNYQVMNQTAVIAGVEAPEVKFTNKEVSEEDVKSAIKSYADEKQKQGSRQLATIFNTSTPRFANNIITLTIQNETQKEQLLFIKQDFIDEIRKLKPEFKRDDEVEWVKSRAARKLLTMSAASLQNLRVTGQVRFRKVLGSY